MARAYRVSPDAVFRDLDGESVILDLASGTYYGLNEVGTRIWTFVAEGLDEEAMAAALTREYEVSLDDARLHVGRLLADLLERRLIAGGPDVTG